jgi:hypothetical protein
MASSSKDLGDPPRPSSPHRASSTSRLLDLVDVSRDDLMDFGEDVEKRVKRFWDGFFDFALQDNILEIAVGLM